EAIELEAKLFTKEDPDYAQSLNNLAQLYIDTENYTAAWQKLGEVIDNMSGLNIQHQLDTEWLNQLSKVNYISNDHIDKTVKALEIIYELLEKDKTIINPHKKKLIVTELAIHLIEKARNRSTVHEDKLEWLNRSNFWLQLSLSILNPQTKGYRAFELSEQNKSILLLQATLSKLNYTLGNLPDSLVLKDKNLHKKRDQIQAKLLEIRPKSEKKDLRNKLNTTDQAIAELNEHIKSNFPKYYKLKNKPISIQAQEVQKLLDDKTLLLEYTLSDSTVHIFSVTNKEIKWLQQKIDPQEFKTNIKQFHRTLSNYILLTNDPYKSYQNYTQLAHWFYQNLLASALKDQTDIEDIIIITDGELGHLPFETFLVKAAPEKETSYKELDYLLNTYNVSYNYSAILWKQNIETPPSANNKQIFALAANYNIRLNSAIATRIVTDTMIRSQLENLPNARKEVETLQTYFKGFFAYDTLASEKTIKQNISDYAVIHLATHGLLNQKRPMLSSLALTEDSDSFENNFWQAHEVSKLDLHANLVILSACETGYGKFERGNGIASLARAFMYAGSTSLIVSLWRVNDASTAILMQNLYENLADKMPIDKALRQAKLQYIQRVDNTAAHPAFWSPFIQIGNTEPITIQRKNTVKGYTWWMFAAAGGLACLGIGIFINRRRNI
ncbi:MAG: CHAT domain-containing protein, partial [Saprospiraceae bacterium]|nr:CHAT domain-containing protein [Saprospiraceae bacterium]